MNTILPMEARFQLVANELERVRQQVCPYPPGGACDCKYGLGYGTNLKVSEKTGCPELREIIRIYQNAAIGNRHS